MVHESFHAMVNGKELWLYWIIQGYTQLHNKILKVIACLNSNMNDISCTVVE